MSRASLSVLLAPLLVVTLGLSSCGSDGNDRDSADDKSSDDTTATGEESSGDEGAVEPTGEEVEVLALDNNFRPEDLEIEAGTTVVWDNGGRNDHNIVPVDDTADWGVDVAEFGPGDVYSHAFTTPGEYPFYCTLHGTADFGMIGTVVVTG